MEESSAWTWWHYPQGCFGSCTIVCVFLGHGNATCGLLERGPLDVLWKTMMRVWSLCSSRTEAGSVGLSLFGSAMLRMMNML